MVLTETWGVSLESKKSVAAKDTVLVKVLPPPRSWTEGEAPSSSVSKLICDGPYKLNSAACVKLTRMPKAKLKFKLRIREPDVRLRLALFGETRSR